VARTTPVKKAWRALAWLLVIIIGLTGINVYGVLAHGWTWAPKLALDLEGGTQIILSPQLADGQADPTREQLEQAVGIIRQRVDASGVSEAEITTQGDRNVVVALPGEPDQATLDRIQSSAKLEFRAVICSTDDPAPSVACTPTGVPTPTPTAETDPTVVDGVDDGTTDEGAATEETPAAEETPATSDEPTTEPADASDEAWVTPALLEQYAAFDCAAIESSGNNVADPTKPLVTCDDAGTAKFILGPVEVSGEMISDATSSTVTNAQGINTGVWAVNIEFNGTGTDAFSTVTSRLIGYDGTVRNRFAIVLDGSVITSPGTNDPITNGKAQITGSFDQDSSKALADKLKFGALPIGFQIESNEVISATLGSSQLQSGLIAGLIGLILVVIYSLFQYRALASVTIASLVVAGVITYLIINILAWRNGYRLSLAGVAGLIVAIGLTADSFIVYFERIRDELRDGRSLVGSVEAGWKRALRTVLAAKAVNLLSAVVLFVLAVGNVRGFALTLGLTTIIDVLVVVLFTHPILQLLATTRFFSSGHPISGLDPKALGAVYRGRAQFRAPVVAGPKGTGAAKEAVRRQTIAERKAAELEESSASQGTASKGTERKDS